MRTVKVRRVKRKLMNKLIRGVGFGIRNDLKPFCSFGAVQLLSVKCGIGGVRMIFWHEG
jgi:hypothetical protein